MLGLFFLFFFLTATKVAVSAYYGIENKYQMHYKAFSQELSNGNLDSHNNGDK